MDYQEVNTNLNADEIDRLNLDLNEMSWEGEKRNLREMGGNAMRNGANLGSGYDNSDSRATSSKEYVRTPEVAPDSNREAENGIPSNRGSESEISNNRETESINPGSGERSEIVSPDALRVKGIASEEQRFENNDLELGRIVPTMPPGFGQEAARENAQPMEQSEAKGFSFERSHAMSGEHLSEKAIEALKDRERKMFADGDIAAFTDEIYDDMEVFQGRTSK